MSRPTRGDPQSLLRPSWGRRLIQVGLILGVIVALLAATVALFRRDQPPSQFSIVTGPPGSASYLAAENYQRIAQENGFTLEIVTAEDVQDRIDMLLAGEASVGFVPSGAAIELQIDELRTLASVYYEPLWVIYRRASTPDAPIDDLHALQGMRIAVGPGSISTERLARLLLELNGVTEQTATFLDLSRAEAVEGLQGGRVDVAFFVGTATEDLVLPLLRDPALDIVSFKRADAYASRYRFLTTLTLPEGLIDLETNTPSDSKRLLSSVANVVIRADLHPDLIRLMTIALVQTHEPGGLFEKPFEFPNGTYADLPISREYLAYLEQVRSGESQLDNIFPFRIAALIDRVYLFVVPILLLLIPIVFRGPGVYSTFMRRRLYTWYQLLRDIEKRTIHMNSDQIEISERALDEMERRLEDRFSISRGYLAGYYDLRMHIALVRGKLQERREEMRHADGASASAGVPVTAESNAAVSSGTPDP